MWAGRILSLLPAALLLFSAAMKFMGGTEVEQGFEHLGWPYRLAVPLGVLEITCTLVYLVPQTAVLGAILLTGYLGGAVATHVRLEEQFVMPALLGVMIWGGLFLRDPRLQALIPFQR
jgi:hypothetical protein